MTRSRTRRLTVSSRRSSKPSSRPGSNTASPVIRSTIPSRISSVPGGAQSQSDDWQQESRNGWQTWYTYRPSGEEQQEDNDSPGGYRWTYHRTRRRGNFLVRLLGIYLLIQIVAMLFGSCGYRGAYYDPYYYRNYSYSDSGTYSGQSQSQTGSDTGSGSWY